MSLDYDHREHIDYNYKFLGHTYNFTLCYTPKNYDDSITYWFGDIPARNRRRLMLFCQRVYIRHLVRKTVIKELLTVKKVEKPVKAEKKQREKKVKQPKDPYAAYIKYPDDYVYVEKPAARYTQEQWEELKEWEKDMEFEDRVGLTCGLAFTYILQFAIAVIIVLKPDQVINGLIGIAVNIIDHIL